MVMSPQLQQIMELEKSREQQGDNTTTSAQQSPELKAVLEAEQKLETGKGLSEPDFLPFFAGSSFESDIQDVYAKGKLLNASPEEIANMIRTEYGDKYLIEERKVSQQEKDDMWTPGIFVADKEYIVRDPLTKEALSLDNPGFSWSQVVGAATAIGKELPAAYLTRGKSLGTKILGMGASGAGVNLADQTGIKALGGKEEISPGEVGLAGALTAGGELFGPIIWAGTKLLGSSVIGLGRAVGNIGRRLEIGQTKKNVSEILGTKMADDVMTKAEAKEAVARIQDGWTTKQRNDMYKKAQEQEKLYGNLVSSLKDVELTPAEKLQLLKDMNLTPAERSWDPALGEFNQTPEAKNAMRDEETLRRYFPEYAEQLDKRLEDAASLVDRSVAKTSTIEGRELVKQQELKKSLEEDIEKTNIMIKHLRANADEAVKQQPGITTADNLYNIALEKETAKLIEQQKKLADVEKEIDLLTPKVEEKSMASSLTKEGLEENIIENVDLYHQSLRDSYKKLYNQVEKYNSTQLTDEQINNLIPQSAINKLPKPAESIIQQFKAILEGELTIGEDAWKAQVKTAKDMLERPDVSEDVKDWAKSVLKMEKDYPYLKKQLGNIEQARKFLNNEVERYYTKANANYDPIIAERLKEVRIEFDNNFDKIVDDVGPIDFEKPYQENIIPMWADNVKSARKAFSDYKEKFGEDKLLKKVVDDLNKGQKSVSQITNLLFNASGQGKFGSDVTKAIIGTKDSAGNVVSPGNEGLRNAIKDYVYATTFFEKGNLLTGQKLTTRFGKVKNNKEIEEIFGKKDWNDFVEKAEKLQSLDVVRGKQGRGSPTQPRQEDQRAYGILTGKKDFWVKGLDAIGVTKDASTDAQNKQALKEYVLQTVYGYTEPPKIKEGLPSYFITPTRAALAQEEAQFTSDLIDSATSNDEDDE